MKLSTKGTLKSNSLKSSKEFQPFCNSAGQQVFQRQTTPRRDVGHADPSFLCQIRYLTRWRGKGVISSEPGTFSGARDRNFNKIRLSLDNIGSPVFVPGPTFFCVVLNMCEYFVKACRRFDWSFRCKTYGRRGIKFKRFDGNVIYIIFTYWERQMPETEISINWYRKIRDPISSHSSAALR